MVAPLCYDPSLLLNYFDYSEDDSAEEWHVVKRRQKPKNNGRMKKRAPKSRKNPSQPPKKATDQKETVKKASKVGMAKIERPIKLLPVINKLHLTNVKNGLSYAHAVRSHLGA